MTDENVSPHFVKVVKGDNFRFLNINFYIEPYHWKAPLTRKIIMLITIL